MGAGQEASTHGQAAINLAAMMADPDPPSGAAANIEVGAADGDLRYWLAKEAMRQGEARLNAQNSVRTTLEARATAITGWAAVGFLATVGAGVTAKDLPTLSGAGAAGAVLFMAGAVGIFAARPRVWSLVGYEPDPVMALSKTLGTELEVLESISGGLADGIKVNNKRLDRMGSMLRWAGWLLIGASLVGGAVYRGIFTLCGWTEARALAAAAGRGVGLPAIPVGGGIRGGGGGAGREAMLLG